MKLCMHISQLRVGDVRVNLGGGNRCVTKQRLYTANISAVLQQVSGEAMTKCVRSNFMHDAGKRRVFFDDALDAARRKPGRYQARVLVAN